MVRSTTAAGTIIQTARGLESLLTRSARDDAPTAFSATSSGHRPGREVEDHGLVPGPQQPAHHVGAHAAEPDHPELHHFLLMLR